MMLGHMHASSVQKAGIQQLQMPRRKIPVNSALLVISLNTKAGVNTVPNALLESSPHHLVEIQLQHVVIAPLVHTTMSKQQPRVRNAMLEPFHRSQEVLRQKSVPLVWRVSFQRIQVGEAKKYAVTVTLDSSHQLGLPHVHYAHQARLHSNHRLVFVPSV